MEGLRSEKSSDGTTTITLGKSSDDLISKIITNTGTATPTGTSTDLETLQMMIEVADGNPGAATVLKHILLARNNIFLRQLLIAMKLTNTPSHALWSFYKKRRYDAELVAHELKQWFSSSVQPLDIWDGLQ